MTKSCLAVKGGSLKMPEHGEAAAITRTKGGDQCGGHH